jgi:hypothetical protein
MVVAPSYIGDYGTATKQLTEIMGLLAVLNSYKHAFGGRTPFYNVLDVTAQMKDHLALHFAIYDKTGARYTDDCKPGYYNSNTFVSVQRHHADVPNLTTAGEYVDKTLNRLKGLPQIVESKTIIEIYGYSEIFDAYPKNIILNPIGHRGTIFLSPTPHDQPITYDKFLEWTEYCNNWKTLFPFHRRPMWAYDMACYSWTPIPLSHKSETDKKIVELASPQLDDSFVRYEINPEDLPSIRPPGATDVAPQYEQLDNYFNQINNAVEQSKALGANDQADGLLSFAVSEEVVENPLANFFPSKQEKKDVSAVTVAVSQQLKLVRGGVSPTAFNDNPSPRPPPAEKQAEKQPSSSSSSGGVVERKGKRKKVPKSFKKK